VAVHHFITAPSQLHHGRGTTSSIFKRSTVTASAAAEEQMMTLTDISGMSSQRRSNLNGRSCNATAEAVNATVILMLVARHRESGAFPILSHERPQILRY
jgi:aspartate carbamoyltransferase catalytic subunit